MTHTTNQMKIIIMSLNLLAQYTHLPRHLRMGYEQIILTYDVEPTMLTLPLVV